MHVGEGESCDARVGGEMQENVCMHESRLVPLDEDNREILQAGENASERSGERPNEACVITIQGHRFHCLREALIRSHELCKTSS